MAKKKSCQNVRVPRVLSVVERELYGWVDEEIFTQPSVIEADALPELRREMRLTTDRAAEGDYVLEATGPSDRLPFRAQEDRVHFLWVRFSSTFERVCLHFGFRLSWRVFLYTYQLHAPSPGRGFMSFRIYQGRKLFDSFEESIQEFKWHYFKVLPLPGRRPFWLSDEGAPFPWVYWNAEVGDFRVTALDPLETLAFDFLQSLPAGLGKKSNFKCRWILDHSDVEVGAFLASGTVPAPDVPPVSSSGTSKATGKSTGAAPAKPFSVEKEEGAKEDLATDLRQNMRKRKVSEASAEEAALGGDSAWKHKVNPIDRAFLPDYNFRAALDAGLTNALILEVLEPLVPEQLLGTAQFLAYQLTACLQVYSCWRRKDIPAKVQLEKELAAAREEAEVLTTERDSSLAAPLLYAKIKSLTEDCSVLKGSVFPPLLVWRRWKGRPRYRLLTLSPAILL
ncbi:hypothetical protein PIB30_091816 [Stylosanthes scabra]|uniref:Uncharacterized protein n=1 Tax=Stylosanthes scabra TaxID=79078 RepID=A0ABU6YSA4_9FABA|nr:hypothetical protein [Stylosanthes scabra]